jgi:outer membrane protein assembly factor BamB
MTDTSSTATTRRRYLQGLSTAAVGATALSEFGSDRARAAAGEAWPQFGFDPANTAHVAGGEEPRDDSTVDSRWWNEGTSDLDGGSTPAGPAVADGTVFVGTTATSSGGELYALSTDDGTVQWRRETPGDVSVTPAVVGDTVYVTDSPNTREQSDMKGRLYALDAATGESRWTLQSKGSELGPPIVAGDRILFSVSESNRSYETTYAALVAVSLVDGTRDWTVERDAVRFTSPAVAGKTVYVGTGAFDTVGTLLAVDLDDGAEHSLTEFSTPIHAPPTVTDGVVFVSTGDSMDGRGRLYAIDATSGDRHWSYDTKKVVYSTVATTGDVVVLPGQRLRALDAASGEKRWTFRPGNPVGPPIVAGNTVYATGDRIYAIDLSDGAELWNQSTGSSIAMPAFDGDTVYTTGYNDVFAFSENRSTPTATSSTVTTSRTTGTGMPKTETGRLPGTERVNTNSVPTTEPTEPVSRQAGTAASDEDGQNGGDTEEGLSLTWFVDGGLYFEAGAFLVGLATGSGYAAYRKPRTDEDRSDRPPEEGSL